MGWPFRSLPNSAGDVCRWNARQVSNQWVKLTIVLQFGGGLTHVTFGDHAYQFVNPQWEGKQFPIVDGTSQPRWYNYGRRQALALPQGDQDDQHWPGPNFRRARCWRLRIQDSFSGLSVQGAARGPSRPAHGMEYSREITLGSGSPEISFHSVMRNSIQHPIHWSMQSVTQYDAGSDSPSSCNRNFWAFTPINGASAYPEGHYARAGPWSDPAYSARDELFTLPWRYFEKEVWLDSTSGWLAVVDGSARDAMVKRFPHVEAEYPGKATVIFYTNGPAPNDDEKGMRFLTSSNPVERPFYMEAEVNSPMVRLAPGETYALDTRWFPTRAGDDLVSVSDAGVGDRPLTAKVSANGVTLSGSFGVFFPGNLTAYVFDKQGSKIATVLLQCATPLDPIDLNKEISVSPTGARVANRLIDEEAVDRGSIGEASITR